MFDRNKVKTKLDKDMIKLIVDSRTEVGMNATQLASSIGKLQTWIAQIETGRIKNISNVDLIAMFKNMFAFDTDEEAIEYIEKHQKSTQQFMNEEDIIIYKDDIKEEDVEKLKKEYDEIIENINTGFNVFFEKVDNKKDALDMLNQICHNMHSSLGYALSLYSLPWCAFGNLNQDEKRSLIKELVKFIKDNGTTCSDSEDGKHC